MNTNMGKNALILAMAAAALASCAPDAPPYALTAPDGRPAQLTASGFPAPAQAPSMDPVRAMELAADAPKPRTEPLGVTLTGAVDLSKVLEAPVKDERRYVDHAAIAARQGTGSNLRDVASFTDAALSGNPNNCSPDFAVPEMFDAVGPLACYVIAAGNPGGEVECGIIRDAKFRDACEKTVKLAAEGGSGPAFEAAYDLVRIASGKTPRFLKMPAGK